MNDFIFTLFMIALLTGAFVLGSILTSFTTTFKTGKEVKELIQQCESSLPRNQFCELTAQPVGE